jgi:hypothetical protein
MVGGVAGPVPAARQNTSGLVAEANIEPRSSPTSSKQQRPTPFVHWLFLAGKADCLDTNPPSED